MVLAVGLWRKECTSGGTQQQRGEGGRAPRGWGRSICLELVWSVGVCVVCGLGSTTTVHPHLSIFPPKSELTIILCIIFL